MESLYLLLPLSVLLVLALIGVFGWAVNAGQFDDLDREGWRVLEENPGETLAMARTPFDPDQA
jgi:cbb3-type cytochrome oxidase maturation protein